MTIRGVYLFDNSTAVDRPAKTEMLKGHYTEPGICIYVKEKKTINR